MAKPAIFQGVVWSKIARRKERTRRRSVPYLYSTVFPQGYGDDVVANIIPIVIWKNVERRKPRLRRRAQRLNYVHAGVGIFNMGTATLSMELSLSYSDNSDVTANMTMELTLSATVGSINVFGDSAEYRAPYNPTTREQRT